MLIAFLGSWTKMATIYCFKYGFHKCCKGLGIRQTSMKYNVSCNLMRPRITTTARPNNINSKFNCYSTKNLEFLEHNFLKSLSRIGPRPHHNPQGTQQALVSSTQLGINNFQKINAHIRKNIDDMDIFITQMTTSICPNSEEIVHADDVKKMISCCEIDVQHISLTLEVIKKYYQDCKTLECEPERFGPIVARLIYILEQPDFALKVLHSEELKACIYQYSTFLVLLSLLYNHGRFEDVVQVMDTIMKQKLLNYPKNCMVVACAAAFMIDTDESLQKVLSWLRDLEAVGKVNLRCIIFIAAMALNRNDAKLAKFMISKVEEANSVIINNIFLLSSCYLGEFEDVLDSFRISLHMNKLGRSQPILSRDVADEIENIILKTEDIKLIEDFFNLKRLLEKCRFFSNQTFEQLLFEPITEFTKPHNKRMSNMELRTLINDINELETK